MRKCWTGHQRTVAKVQNIIYTHKHMQADAKQTVSLWKRGIANLLKPQTSNHRLSPISSSRAHYIAQHRPTEREAECDIKKSSGYPHFGSIAKANMEPKKKHNHHLQPHLQHIESPLAAGCSFDYSSSSNYFLCFFLRGAFSPCSTTTDSAEYIVCVCICPTGEHTSTYIIVVWLKKRRRRRRTHHHRRGNGFLFSHFFT